uniref:Superoxide dismutase [Cu-Zn] n=1 Tax=Ulva fasciata TaxID=111617 RepID=Q2V8E6_9CHLO|nr:copper/zinc superoxide dismutase [Ulva fasciata]
MSVRATCVVGPNGQPCHGGEEAGQAVSGVVNFEQNVGEPCKITYNITGLTPGQHGFHVHESCDFSNGCVSAGPHYNPFNKTHGGPEDEERHVGDLGNIVANEAGVASGEMTDRMIQLTGEYTIVGRSMMVHAGVDDLGKGGHELSSTTGNAGGRVACGEIKLVN